MVIFFIDVCFVCPIICYIKSDGYTDGDIASITQGQQQQEERQREPQGMVQHQPQQCQQQQETQCEEEVEYQLQQVQPQLVQQENNINNNNNDPSPSPQQPTTQIGAPGATQKEETARQRQDSSFYDNCHSYSSSFYDR